MRSSRPRLLAAAVLPVVLLAGCGDDKPAASPSSPSSSAGASGAPSSSASSGPASPGASGTPGTPLTVPADKVTPITAATVGRADPAKPTVALTTKPFQVNTTTVKVVTNGTGRTVGDKDIVYTSYVAVNGTNGKTIESTFGKPSAAFNLANRATFPGLAKALRGKKVGTEMLVAVPPAEGFGADGKSQVGVSAKDTLVFLVKVNGSMPILKKAEGTPVTPPANLPKVTIADTPTAQATITIPKGVPAPTKLVNQQLIKGTGPNVVAGQNVLVNYTGALYADGKVFDAAAKQNQPASFPIGAGQVIKAWDQAIVGQPIGSRLLIVAPPDLAYGKEAKKDQQGKTVIPANSTLVFVVDVLAAM